mmetsp:Transcript_12805/g.18894  ORF Transcript_12805/g.18894 Transcript_12805/m.18894 type:complete len:233 (-) Transcript_12805:776-1474(-)
MKSCTGINITLIIDTDPLEFHIRHANGTLPTILVVTEFNGGRLVRSLGFLCKSKRKFESNTLTRIGVGRTSHKDTNATGKQGKGLARLDASRYFDFKELCLFVLLLLGSAAATTGGSLWSTSNVCTTWRRRWNDTDRHAWSCILRTGNHELLSLDGNGELLSAANTFWNCNHVCCMTRSVVWVVDATDIGGIWRHGTTASTSRRGRSTHGSSCRRGRTTATSWIRIRRYSNL